MQKDEQMKRQTKIDTGAVKTSNCMNVDLAFSTSTTHSTSWGIHSNGINTTQTRQRQYQEKRREKKKFNTFFTIVSAITVQEAEE